MSIIAELRQVNGNVVVFDPIVMGSPWLEADESGPYQSIAWYSSEFYQQFVEDFDEFARIKVAPQPPSPEPMRHISEAAVKRCFSRLLGDAAAKDWAVRRQISLRHTFT